MRAALILFLLFMIVGGFLALGTLYVLDEVARMFAAILLPLFGGHPQ